MLPFIRLMTLTNRRSSSPPEWHLVPVTTPNLSDGSGYDGHGPGKNHLRCRHRNGVLAILAAKLGATDILALDNNEWAYNNALDNLALNDVLEVVDMQLAEPRLYRTKNLM